MSEVFVTFEKHYCKIQNELPITSKDVWKVNSHRNIPDQEVSLSAFPNVVENGEIATLIDAVLVSSFLGPRYYKLDQEVMIKATMSKELILRFTKHTEG